MSPLVLTIESDWLVCRTSHSRRTLYLDTKSFTSGIDLRNNALSAFDAPELLCEDWPDGEEASGIAADNQIESRLAR